MKSYANVNELISNIAVTGSAPLQREPHAALSTGALEPSSEGDIPTAKPGYSATHQPSPKLRKMFWPEFRVLQNEFSAIVSKLSEVLSALKPAQFDRLLVYLGERLKPING